MRRKKPGRYLEWHGNQLRVVVAVPAAKRAAIGKATIKVPLHTDDTKAAEVLKWPIIERLKREINGIKTKPPKRVMDDMARALAWRDALADADQGPDAVDVRSILLETEIMPLAREGRGEEAQHFLAIADGRATPFETHVDDWIKGNLYSGRTEEKARHAVSVFVAWCEKTGTVTTFEAVTSDVTDRFVQETYIQPKKNPTTANVVISWIARYWEWCRKAKSYSGGNPWDGRRIKKDVAKRMLQADRVGEADEKRPFTDDEVKKLVTGTEGVLRDFILFAALTGMRRSEIGALKVSDIRGDSFFVRGGKTEAARRQVPINTALADLVKERTQAKPSDAFLFHDLPGKETEKRDRTAALSQVFTRQRRKLGIGSKMRNSQQDDTDLHSFRRWFIQKAVDALAGPNPGFTGWTISDVVGHDKEQGPLGMTMGRYPGAAPVEQLRSCVEAVKLPKGCL